MTKKGYITSERFIHDDLLTKCERLFQTAKTVLQKKEDPSIVILWPGEAVKAEDGTAIEHEIFAELPAENRTESLCRLVETAKAYGLLVIELQPHALVAIFESPHGTRSWRSSIQLRGDVRVPAETVVKNDVDHHGLLWSPKQGTA